MRLYETPEFQWRMRRQMVYWAFLYMEPKPLQWFWRLASRGWAPRWLIRIPAVRRSIMDGGELMRLFEERDPRPMGMEE